MKLFKRKVKCINCKYYSKLNMVCNAPYLWVEKEYISFVDARECDHYEKSVKPNLYKNDIEYFLGQWIEESKIRPQLLMFSINSKRKVIYIYTYRPDYLNGKAGCLINKYKNIFKAYKYKVILKEVSMIYGNN